MYFDQPKSRDDQAPIYSSFTTIENQTTRASTQVGDVTYSTKRNKKTADLILCLRLRHLYFFLVEQRQTIFRSRKKTNTNK